MAESNTRKLPPGILQDDLATFAALKAIAGYSPANQDYTIAKGDTKKTAKEAAQTAAVQAKVTADARRDDQVASEWDFHAWVLGSVDQVKAQFGPNSNELQSLGRKKKSEYKKPTRKKTP